MKILVANDDGIHAPGLWKLVDALADLGEITVSAPDRDQSGVGTAMTLLDVVKAREVDAPNHPNIKAFAVEGTPADCVILAAETLAPGGFDLVVSGINEGSNLGLDILTSGTVGAAFQGYFRGIHSIAASVASLTNVRFDAAARAVRALAQTIAETRPAAPLLLNVNIPNLDAAAIAGARIASLGPRLYLENVDRGNNGRRTHYWIKHNRLANRSVGEDTDIYAIRANRAAVTALNGVFDPGAPLPDMQPYADAVERALGVGAAKAAPVA